MVIIRLQRVGRKNDPSFRIIATDHRQAAKAGKVLEVVGSYDARHGKPEIKIDRVKHWLSHGAQVSGTVHNLLVDAKVIEGKKINVLSRKTAIAPAAETPTETPAAVAETPTETV